MTPPPSPAAALPGRMHINLRWFLRLRSWALVGQALLVLAMHAGLGVALPLTALVALLALEAASTVLLRVWLPRRVHLTARTLAGVMLWDCAVLTLLLFLMGGSFNPFTTLYLVNIALAAVLLPARLAWGVLAATLLAFASLFVLQERPAPFGLQLPGHAEMMRLHLHGMWVAFAVAGAFIVHFVQRVTSALAAREAELARAVSLSARKDKVASLATLAAGAAHELASPLGTIAVASRELERALEGGPAREDVQLIRQQVARCRDILQQMAADAGQLSGEPFVQQPVAAWVEAALAELPEAARVERPVGPALQATVRGPPRALARVLRGLVKNALQASPAEARVRVSAERVDGALRVAVQDSGRGMSPETLARAGEPFFTTKAPGEGMGLGLFLTRALLEQLGGSLELSSRPGEGTTAALVLPASEQEAEVAS
ncbi:HAMP domain-containing histidine kinase [Aggregicoccus sp. 17bor-14]|uniref:sensor histidine kinase n=1 Tax=Myxococcaceae TaxID=31 RepID=UPI00129C988E|nr:MULTISPECIES: HAMP domain-containing sensor histidine kinase [Myxococcaceae]MBF5043430.1 HAMP domain-containing histidine kinase [Simulacricoccus sp. 17bor-14]MRI89188.1 HAMP domain-containing histidine kinase [Aggregicoccus sp. 17bor-14]